MTSTRFRVVAAMLIGVLATSLLGGCGRRNKEEPVEANAPYELSEITSGLYIMSKDGKFYYPNTDNQTFNHETTSADSRRIIYSHEDTKYIPTVYADDLIVYFTKKEIPESFGIERFRDAGYTLGLYQLSKDASGHYVFNGNNLIRGSEFEYDLNGYVGTADTATILTIDDKEVETLDMTQAGTIANLEKDQKVKFAFMKGTFYSEFEATADEHVWYSAETYEPVGYQATKNGFIVLTFDHDAFADSYISIAGTGLMYVSEAKRPAAESK